MNTKTMYSDGVFCYAESTEEWYVDRIDLEGNEIYRTSGRWVAIGYVETKTTLEVWTNSFESDGFDLPKFWNMI